MNVKGRYFAVQQRGRCHCSGIPALHRPSKMGSSWARYVGSSLSDVQLTRARETVKDGLIAIPTLTVACASASRSSCARARAN